MFCSQCGKQLDNNSQFCSECGAPISPLPDASAAQLPAATAVAPSASYSTDPVNPANQPQLVAPVTPAVSPVSVQPVSPTIHAPQKKPSLLTPIIYLIAAVIFAVAGVIAYNTGYVLLLFRVIPLNSFAFGIIAVLMLGWAIFRLIQAVQARRQFK